MLAFARTVPVLAKPSINPRITVDQRWARTRHIRTPHLHRSQIKASFAQGVEKLEQEGAYAVLDAANALESATGKAVVHLEIGQPQFDTPQHISAAAIEAIKAGKTKYSSPAGIPQLREDIAQRTRRKLGDASINITGRNVVVGPGAKPGMFFATMALVRDRNDEVIVPDPGFPSYAAMVNVAGGTIRRVKLRDGDLASFDMEEFRNSVSGNTRLVVLNSPGNPTGGVMPEEDLREISELAVKHDFWVISDEIYSDLIYSDDDFVSIIGMPNMLERTVVVDGFSKSWCMTGWRLGWAVMPEKLVERVELLMTHSVGCTATFTQWAGVAALSHIGTRGIEEMRSVYKRRRDIVVEALNDIEGVTCAVPQGAFYALADVSAFGETSKVIADTLLKVGFVAVLPGTDFGDNGEGYIRISYVSDDAVLIEGISRIKTVLDKMMAEKMALKS